MQNMLFKAQAATLTKFSLWLFGWLFLLLPTLALTAALPTVSRVKDINTIFNSAGSDPRNIVKVGNITFFTAATTTTGRELWKTDGTAAGTVMVKDIRAGSPFCSDNDCYDTFTVVGNVLYFVANNGMNGRELWRSDGTAAGTVMVKDIIAGYGSPFCDYQYCYDPNLTAVGNVLYFVNYNGANGTELWRSDGTAAGTVIVKNIVTKDDGIFLHYLTAVGNVLYFATYDDVHGKELWKSDGTAMGTIMVKDINTGSGGTWNVFNPPNFTAVGNVLYFSANNGVNGNELWRSDGTAAGTVMVKDINAGSGDSYPHDLTALGNVLYFSANNGVNGNELWRSDGTAVGTVMVKDINAGTGSSSPHYLTAVGNVLYFSANNGINGEELWRSNGTAAGTVMVKDINAGGGSSFFCDEYSCVDPNFTAVGNVLYFRVDDGVHGYELWRSDGTAASTIMVKDINAGSGSAWSDDDYSYFIAVSNMLYFQANNGVNGSELWRSDGTAAGTMMVKDINAGSDSSYPGYLTAVGNVLYFVANNGVNGNELWKSNGTAAGTVLVKDIYPGSNGSYLNNLTAVGNVLYFGASNVVNGYELWKSDGTAAGTVMVKDINAGIGDGLDYIYFAAVGNVLYFTADNGVNGNELWKSNGTAAGTVMVKDINAGTGNSYPYNLTTVDNVLYFSANNGVHGNELWRSDGTAAGTVMVKDINAGTGNSYPYNLTTVGNVLYFVADNGVNDEELWKSDGTAAGTVLVKDIYPGSSSSSPDDLTAVGNVLYFRANDGVHGYELWRSDGTAAGTVMVKDINAGTGNSYPLVLTVVGNVLYFSANNGVHGWELWKSAGTAAGTVMVKDIYPGSGSSLDDYSNLTAVGNVLYFDAYNGVNGEELWQSDGTTAGTQMIEIVPGSGSSTPVGLTSIGTRLYFSAVDDVAGRELWKADPPVPSPDFVITAVTLNPATSALNGTFAATVTVKNQGNLAGDGKFLDVWSHQPTAQPCAATGTARQSVGTLAAGASKVLTFSALNAGTVAGMKMFRAFVDSGCGTAESNNANNQFIKVYPVNQPTATADLTVTNVVINTAAPVANGVITATVTVKNQGTTTADGKNLEVWSHQPTAQACGAIGNARQTVGSLAVGVSKTLTFSGLPAGIAGAKTLRAYVDSGCGTTETNEDNNQLTKAYTVQ